MHIPQGPGSSVIKYVARICLDCHMRLPRHFNCIWGLKVKDIQKSNFHRKQQIRFLLPLCFVSLQGKEPSIWFMNTFFHYGSMVYASILPYSNTASRYLWRCSSKQCKWINQRQTLSKTGISDLLQKFVKALSNKFKPV